MAILVNLLVLLAVILLGQATWNPRLTQSLDSDLDDQLCQTETHTTTIIDIHESMQQGAELMDGVWKESLVECMSGCCATTGCDLALFKNVGVSKTGKNCYYVHCGAKENCKIVPHTAFTSVLFLPRPSSTRNLITGSSTPSVEHATPLSTSPSTPPSTHATTIKLSPASAGTTHTQTHSTPSPSEKSGRGSTSTTVAMTTEPTMEEDSTPGSTDSNSSVISSNGSKAKGGKGLASNAGKVVVPEKVKPESAEDDPCGQYGCDGSGIVAVVVVAVICFVIVLVVVAIMAKKAVTERRKRKFRNVDYLINGMYT